MEDNKKVKNEVVTDPNVDVDTDTPETETPNTSEEQTDSEASD